MKKPLSLDENVLEVYLWILIASLKYLIDLLEKFQLQLEDAERLTDVYFQLHKVLKREPQLQLNI